MIETRQYELPAGNQFVISSATPEAAPAIEAVLRGGFDSAYAGIVGETSSGEPYALTTDDVTSLVDAAPRIEDDIMRAMTIGRTLHLSGHIMVDDQPKVVSYAKLVHGNVACGAEGELYSGELTESHVLPEFQGGGIGAIHLWERALYVGETYGEAAGLRLECADGNGRAASWYGRLGFEGTEHVQRLQWAPDVTVPVSELVMPAGALCDALGERYPWLTESEVVRL